MKKGFTIVEFLIIVVVMTILAAILVPTFAQARERRKVTQCLSNMRQIGNALVMYSNDNSEMLPAVDMSVLTAVGSGYLPGTQWFQGLSGPNVKPDYDALQTTYVGLLIPYVKNNELFKCPSDSNSDCNFTNTNTKRLTSYGFRHYMAANIRGSWGFPMPAQISMLSPGAMSIATFPKPSQTFVINEEDISHGRNKSGPNKKTNVILMDGHAKFYKTSIIAPIKYPCDLNWPKFWDMTFAESNNHPDYSELIDIDIKWPYP